MDNGLCIITILARNRDAEILNYNYDNNCYSSGYNKYKVNMRSHFVGEDSSNIGLFLVGKFPDIKTTFRRFTYEVQFI